MKALLLAAVILFCTAPVALAAGGGKSKRPADMWSLPDHVQLSPLTVPVAGQKYRAVPITLYLQVVDKEELGFLCRMSARIRDAVLNTTFEHPLPRKGKYGFDLDLLAGQVLKPINKALRKRMVKKVYIQLGARRFGSGAVMKLPFGSASGCRSIKELEAKKLRQKKQ